MYQKILVPMALDHGVSQETLGIAKSLMGGTGEIIAQHRLHRDGITQTGVQRLSTGLHCRACCAACALRGARLSQHVMRA